jgi:TRAP transporter TAXI family solute receptor
MKRRITWTLVLAGALLVWSGPGARAGEPLGLATGQPGDFFWIMGKELCRVWGADGLPAEVVETAGDGENIDLVVSGKADAALVSGLALADFLKANPGAPIVTVASCWKSAVHVILNGQFIKTGSVCDLAGKKLYLGSEISPDGIAVRRILAALGITPKRYVREIGRSELLAAMTDFRKQELDGAIIIGPVPDPMVRDIISGTGGSMRFIPADESIASALRAAGLPVFLSTIPKESYSYQADDVAVIAMGTYLISRNDLADETARRLSAGIFKNANRIAGYFPQGQMLLPEDAAAHLIAPLHPGLK